MRTLLLVLVIAHVSALAEPAKKKTTVRKTQEVNFEETDIEGVVRSPDGAYLLQKRGVKFMPLYKVQKHFDDEIKSSVDYLR